MSLADKIKQILASEGIDIKAPYYADKADKFWKDLGYAYHYLSAPNEREFFIAALKLQEQPKHPSRFNAIRELGYKHGLHVVPYANNVVGNPSKRYDYIKVYKCGDDGVIADYIVGFFI